MTDAHVCDAVIDVNDSTMLASLDAGMSQVHSLAVGMVAIPRSARDAGIRGSRHLFRKDEQGTSAMRLEYARHLPCRRRSCTL